jgi:putative transposase
VPNYRRWHRTWGSYFITIATHERYPIFRDARARLLLGRAFRETAANWPLTVHELVLLPDHLHLLCSIPDDEQDYSTRIRLIKKRFTRAWLAGDGREGGQSPSRRRRGIRGVWQKRFYEHTIRNERGFRDHVVYIFMNPVKHGLVTRVVDWPWSTFQRHVAQGDLAPDWSGPTELRGVGECAAEVW